MRVLFLHTVSEPVWTDWGENHENMSQDIGSLGREPKVIYMKQNATIEHRLA